MLNVLTFNVKEREINVLMQMSQALWGNVVSVNKNRYQSPQHQHTSIQRTYT